MTNVTTTTLPAVSGGDNDPTLIIGILIVCIAILLLTAVTLFASLSKTNCLVLTFRWIRLKLLWCCCKHSPLHREIHSDLVTETLDELKESH